jgi:hypothetical protein
MENKNSCAFCNRPILQGDAHPACLQNSLAQAKRAQQNNLNYYQQNPVQPYIYNQPQIQFRCPFCQSPAGVRVISKTATGGWVGFWITTLLCLIPFNFLFFLIRENSTYCQTCGMKLS